MVTEETTLRDAMQDLNEPTIEFFILADYAEAVGGKLYMMGGGWDRYFVEDFSKPVAFSFAVGILVPWNATNIRHTVQVTIEDLDRKKPINFNVNAGFKAGRPSHIEDGETQRTMLTIPKVGAMFPGSGTYQAVARIVGGHERRVEFRLLQAPTIQVSR